MPSAVRASAPGKVVLMGEHAAVYGRPAVVAALDRRCTARLTAGRGPGIDLHLPDVSYTGRASWTELAAYAVAAAERGHDAPEVSDADASHLARVALGEAARAFPAGADDHRGVEVRITSAVPMSGGYGSSAALAVATVAAATLWLGGDPSVLEAIEGGALAVERRQHGRPSGIDHGTSLRGGVLWVEPAAAGRARFEALAVPAACLAELAVCDSGAAAEPTSAVVAAVGERLARLVDRGESVLGAMERHTRSWRASLEAGTGTDRRALGAIRGFQECLEKLGVVPQGVSSRIRRVEAAGGAAKVCGAGSLTGPGAGAVLVVGLGSVPPAGELAGLDAFDMRLGGPGLEWEAT